MCSHTTIYSPAFITGLAQSRDSRSMYLMTDSINEWEIQSWSGDSSIRIAEAKSWLPFLQGDQPLGGPWQKGPGRLPLWRLVLWRANKKALWQHNFLYLKNRIIGPSWKQQCLAHFLVHTRLVVTWIPFLSSFIVRISWYQELCSDF